MKIFNRGSFYSSADQSRRWFRACVGRRVWRVVHDSWWTTYFLPRVKQASFCCNKLASLHANSLPELQWHPSNLQWQVKLWQSGSFSWHKIVFYTNIVVLVCVNLIVCFDCLSVLAVRYWIEIFCDAQFFRCTPSVKSIQCKTYVAVLREVIAALCVSEAKVFIRDCNFLSKFSCFYIFLVSLLEH